jgi:hydrogenase nickel incorporation protein HypA/HybF
MHELGITHSILNIAVKHAQQVGAIRIKELNLVIGEMSSIVDDSVQFYWEMVSQGTLAEGSILNFRRVAGRLHCDGCGHEFGFNRQDFVCPQCQSPEIRIVGGEEFFLESIDVDFDPEKQRPVQP